MTMTHAAGWYRKHDPTPPDEILRAAVYAARDGDVHTVRCAVRALRRRGPMIADHARAARHLLAQITGRPLPRIHRSPNPRAAGWTRTHDPVPLAEIRAAADQAAAEGDALTLRSALNAFEKRHARAEARITRRMLLFVEADAIIAAHAAAGGDPQDGVT